MTRCTILATSAFLAALAVAAAGHAQPSAQSSAQPPIQSPAPVQVQGAWARATPPGASAGAVYLTLTSPAADTLVGASSPAAQHTGVHEMRMDGTVMRMRELENGLDLPAGTPVELKPGGFHVMLEGLVAPLRTGQAVPVHLTFRNAPPLDVQAQVRPIGATSAEGPPAAGPAHGANMGK